RADHGAAQAPARHHRPHRAARRAERAQRAEHRRHGHGAGARPGRRHRPGRATARRRRAPPPLSGLLRGTDVDRFLFLTVDGLARGVVFGAFALALVLIWRGTRIVNFAQGAMAVATAYAAYSVTGATGSYWLGFAVALLGGLALGAVVERGVMRWVAH